MRRLGLLCLLGILVMAGCTTSPAGPALTTTGVLPSTPAPTAVGQAVTFPATDGVALRGKVFGHGATTVILSNMGDNDPVPWEAFAPLLADRGYTVLSYSFRYPMNTNSFTAAYATATVPDLQGAIAYARGHGAQRIVLIGASLGGITVGKVAAAAHAACVVIVSAEQDLSDYGLTVTPAELAAMTQPKLFVASRDDTNTPYELTRAFYERAPQPKQLHTFAGGVHGVRLFATAHAAELRDLLLDFVTTCAPV